jgi:hypothetical protein
LDPEISRSKDQSKYQTRITGWWLTYPSEKYESHLGLLFPICGKIKAMFQTTNQLQCQKRPETYGSGSKTPTFSDSVKLKAWANASQVVWANASQIRALSSTEVGLYPSILTTNRVDV